MRPRSTRKSVLVIKAAMIRCDWEAQMSANLAPNGKHTLNLVFDITRPLFSFQFGLERFRHDHGQTFSRQLGQSGGEAVCILAFDVQLRAHGPVLVE